MRRRGINLKISLILIVSFITNLYLTLYGVQEGAFGDSWTGDGLNIIMCMTTPLLLVTTLIHCLNIKCKLSFFKKECRQYIVYSILMVTTLMTGLTYLPLIIDLHFTKVPFRILGIFFVFGSIAYVYSRLRCAYRNLFQEGS